ncbi:MAG: integral rane protein TerC family protein [Firmicutes bacterium]|nr:integral rane protein TerC family protein [Bacillota bacterium]
MELIMALGGVILMDLLLAGDNAVIIALASHRLPKVQRRKAILWGSFGAVIFRVLLIAVATKLLTIPYLQFVGGLALLYIAVSLTAEKKEAHCREAVSLWEAIKIIVVADVIMSLDNVLAIAGTATGMGGEHQLLVIIVGLAVSIPLVVFGSHLILKIMDKYSVVIYAGAAVLGLAAAKMMVQDGALSAYLIPYQTILEVTLTAGVVVVGLLLKLRIKIVR